MLRRGIIFVAVVVYLAVLGCVLWPGGAAPAGKTVEAATPTVSRGSTSLTGLPYRSVGVQVQRVDWIEQYKKCVDEIAGVGADTVLFVVDARQENGTSSRVYLDMRMTPTPEQLGDLIRHAKSKNLRVILMPIVLLDAPKGNEWRGTLKPEDWNDWFDSYRDMIKHFAWVAEGNGANVLVVGSELVSSEDKIDQWTKTIGEVREIFKGQLTYSSNWDHYTAIPFWNQLDLIGMNSYWKFGDKEKNPSPSVEQIVARWKEIQSDLLKFVRDTRRPLLFLEIGWFSQANVAYEPWDYTQESEPTDLELQRKLYEGFFKSWYGNPHLGGFSVWDWPPGDGGPDDKGYTPKNKPAEQVLREWLAKPRWDVK